MLLNERVDEAAGFRHSAEQRGRESRPPARGRERWVINKLRALGAWYTKGLEGGSSLRVALNTAESIRQLRDAIEEFFAFQAERAYRKTDSAADASLIS